MNVLLGLLLPHVQEGRYYLETSDHVKYRFKEDEVLYRELSCASWHCGFTLRVRDFNATCVLLPVEGRAHRVFRYDTEEAMREVHKDDEARAYRSGPVYRYHGVERVEVYQGHHECVAVNVHNPADIIDSYRVVPGTRTQYGYAYVEVESLLVLMDGMEPGFDEVLANADP